MRRSLACCERDEVSIQIFDDERWQAQIRRNRPSLFHRLFRHDLRYKLHTVFAGGLMKDVPTVLRQKEQDVERVRQEIQALRVVIPLLADDQPSSDDVMHLLLASCRTAAEPSDKGMADLELYYPFVRHMQISGHK